MLSLSCPGSNQAGFGSSQCGHHDHDMDHLILISNAPQRNSSPACLIPLQVPILSRLRYDHTTLLRPHAHCYSVYDADTGDLLSDALEQGCLPCSQAATIVYKWHCSVFLASISLGWFLCRSVFHLCNGLLSVVFLHHCVSINETISVNRWQWICKRVITILTDSGLQRHKSVRVTCIYVPGHR